MTANHENPNRVLGDAWRALRGVAPDLPEAVILIGSGNGPPIDPEARPVQVFISDAALSFGPIATLSALAHEAVHVLAELRDVGDTSDRGRYHNQAFATIAAELGFTFDNPPGQPLRASRWGTARLRPDNARHPQLRPVDLSLLLKSLGEVLDNKDYPNPPIPMCRARRLAQRPKNERVKATCLCEPARIIYVAPSVLAKGEIICFVCTNEFRVRRAS